MTPINAKGVKARYRMPAFNPRAGFSPSCCAVLVQIEHCACESMETRVKRKTNTKARMNNFCIRIAQN